MIVTCINVSLTWNELSLVSEFWACFYSHFLSLPFFLRCSAQLLLTDMEEASYGGGRAVLSSCQIRSTKSSLGHRTGFIDC